MLQKMEEVNGMRAAVAQTEAGAISEISAASRAAGVGGKIIAFGNGGSATDANDLVADCVTPPPGFGTVPAVSLAAEPANITAIANDVGVEAIFLRQLIAHARPEDVAIGISTSGGSPSILAALAEARKRACSQWASLATTAGGSSASGSQTTRWWCARTTSRASRRYRPPSTTCCGVS